MNDLRIEAALVEYLHGGPHEHPRAMMTAAIAAADAVDPVRVQLEALQAERDHYLTEVQRHKQEFDYQLRMRQGANAALAVAEGRLAAMESALRRTEDNFRLAVNGKPVRDMAENLAENAAALGLLEEEQPPKHIEGMDGDSR